MSTGYSGTAHLGVGGTGQRTVGTSAVALVASSVPAIAVMIKALPGNAGVVYANPTATATDSNGFPLSASEAVGWLPVPGNDLANISVIASEADQGVAFVYLT